MNFAYLFVPLLAAIIAQIIKLVINGLKDQFTWKDLNTYGGMPSSHAALVVSLSAIIGFTENWTSPLFAVTTIFALIVIRDAAGFRRTLGLHAEELNRLNATQQTIEQSTVYLKEKMGHTSWELLCGSIIGLIVTALYFLIF